MKVASLLRSMIPSTGIVCPLHEWDIIPSSIVSVFVLGR